MSKSSESCVRIVKSGASMTLSGKSTESYVRIAQSLSPGATLTIIVDGLSTESCVRIAKAVADGAHIHFIDTE